MNKKWTKTFTNRCTKLRECTVWTVYDLANDKGLLVKEKKCSVDEKCETFSVRLCLRMLGKLMLANFGLKIRPFRESNLKNLSQIKRPMAGTIYYRPVGKGAATNGLATPQQAPEVSWTEDAARFQCQSIDTSVRKLPQKETERAISKDFPAADVYPKPSFFI